MTRTRLLCDFCSWLEPTLVCPAADFSTGIPSEVPGATQASYGEWLACGVCGEFIVRNDRQRLGRHCARMHRRNHPEARGVSINQIERIVEGLHSDFWRHREGAPRPITDEDRERFLALPERMLAKMPGPTPPKPRWLVDLEKEVGRR